MTNYLLSCTRCCSKQTTRSEIEPISQIDKNKGNSHEGAI